MITGEIVGGNIHPILKMLEPKRTEQSGDGASIEVTRTVAEPETARDQITAEEDNVPEVRTRVVIIGHG